MQEISWDLILRFASDGYPIFQQPTLMSPWRQRSIVWSGRYRQVPLYYISMVFVILCYRWCVMSSYNSWVHEIFEIIKKIINSFIGSKANWSSTVVTYACWRHRAVMCPVQWRKGSGVAVIPKYYCFSTGVVDIQQPYIVFATTNYVIAFDVFSLLSTISSTPG